MTVCTVHEPPQPPGDRLDHADQLVFVRDGFSWVATLIAPLWMILHRLWLVLVLYVAGVLALDAGLSAAGLKARWIALVLMAANVAIGFESASLIRWTLDRRGWKYLGAVAGRNFEDCERRFFAAWLPQQPHVRPDALARALDEPAPAAAPRKGRLTRWWRG